MNPGGRLQSPYPQPSPSTADEENEIITQALAIQEEFVWESCRSLSGSPELQSPVNVMAKTLQMGKGEFTRAGFPLFLVRKGVGGVLSIEGAHGGRESEPAGPIHAI